MQNLNPPKISVITAVYNAVNHLPGLIKSLAEQTSTDFEWVVIDGESTDGTVQLIQESCSFPYYLVSEKDFGIYDALNKGIHICRSNYYVIIGADDFFYRDAIQNFSRAITDNPGCGILSARVVCHGKVLSPKKNFPILNKQAVYISAHSVATVFAKDLHHEFGFYSHKFPIAADQLFVMRCALGGVTIKHLHFVAGVFGEGGVSNHDVAGTLSESYRIQLYFFNKYLVTVIFVLKLLKNIRRLK
jgi:glycosyltransferase involved in cell wall biosynthesis